MRSRVILLDGYCQKNACGLKYSTLLSSQVLVAQNPKPQTGGKSYLSSVFLLVEPSKTIFLI